MNRIEIVDGPPDQFAPTEEGYTRPELRDSMIASAATLVGPRNTCFSITHVVIVVVCSHQRMAIWPFSDN